MKQQDKFKAIKFNFLIIILYLFLSFVVPVSLTNTLVQLQNFSVSSVLTNGFYSFRLTRNGGLTLKWNNSILYWSSGANSSLALRNPSLSLSEDGILYLYDPVLSSPIDMALSTDYSEDDKFRFLRLGEDSNLRIYSDDINSGTVTVGWTAVSDQCEVFGYCGNYGICSYNETADPTCSCPSEHFILFNPNDSRKGCKRKVEIKDCPGNATMLEFNHTKFLTYPPELTDVYYMSGSSCRGNCLAGVSCVAYSVLTDGSAVQCILKSSNFVSAVQSGMILGNSFVKVCGLITSAEPNPFHRLRQTTWKLHAWLILLLGGVCLGLGIFAGVLWWSWRRKTRKFGGVSA